LLAVESPDIAIVEGGAVDSISVSHAGFLHRVDRRD
jgi:hypothetical protein